MPKCTAYKYRRNTSFHDLSLRISLNHTCDAVGLQLVEANSLKEFPGRGRHHDRTPAAALGDLLPTTNPGTNLLWFIGDAGVSAWRTKTSNSSVCNHLIGEG